MKKFEPKKILVPVDFSEFSEEALRSAVDIAELRHAKLTIMHVMVKPETSVAYEIYIDWQKIKDDMKVDAEKMLNEMTEKAGINGMPESVLVWGDPAQVILDSAQNDNFDLIVMATHGRTGLTRLFLGSVAEKVIRHAPCPVLVMRVVED